MDDAVFWFVLTLLPIDIWPLAALQAASTVNREMSAAANSREIVLVRGPYISLLENVEIEGSERDTTESRVFPTRILLPGMGKTQLRQHGK